MSLSVLPVCSAVIFAMSGMHCSTYEKGVQKVDRPGVRKIVGPKTMKVRMLRFSVVKLKLQV